MFKIVDKKCIKCGEIMTDIEDSQKICDICGGILKRLYGFRKYNQYPEGYYENFGDRPVYIKDRQHFWKEAKKRGLDVATSEYRFSGKRKTKKKKFNWKNELEKTWKDF